MAGREIGSAFLGHGTPGVECRGTVDSAVMDERDSPDRTPVPRYWFPMKTYGWGWGPPCTWEGTLVTLVYVALLALAPLLFSPVRNMAGFLASVCGLTAVMIAICWWKGEPPRWRWG